MRSVTILIVAAMTFALRKAYEKSVATSKVAEDSFDAAEAFAAEAERRGYDLASIVPLGDPAFD